MIDEKKSIYIAGPMTGKENFNKVAFLDAEYDLSMEGWKVVTPFTVLDMLGYDDAEEAQRSPNLAKVLEAELAVVRACDAIYLLLGWEESVGTRNELAEALTYGKQIILEPW